MNTRTQKLSTEDWVLIGYLIGVVVMWLIERVAESSKPSTSGQTSNPGQRVRLDERALERLEEGKTMQIRRWHGGDIVLCDDTAETAVSEADEGNERPEEDD